MNWFKLSALSNLFIKIAVKNVEDFQEKKFIKIRPQLNCSKNRNTLRESRSQSWKSVHNVIANFLSFFNKSSAMFKILVIFSDGNAQDEIGDIMDTSTLEQTANSLRDNHIDLFGVLIPNTEKVSRIQQLNSIMCNTNDVIDASFNSIVDLLAYRVKRLVGCLGKNFTRDFICYFPK